MTRWCIFLEQWEKALATDKEVIVLGDFNLDHLQFSNSGRLQPMVEKLMDSVFPHGVVQCVQAATHSWPGRRDSGLDHIYTNEPDKLSKVQVQFRGYSDHRLIIATKYAKNLKQNIRYCKKRSYKKFSEQEFLVELGKVSWWDVYCCQDVDISVDIFTSKITNILDKMAPVKKFQLRSKYAAWLNDSSKDKIKQRDSTQQAASVSGSEEDWKSYRKLRNEVTAALVEDKESWQRKKLEECEDQNDAGKLWKNILGWLNWSSTSSPTKLAHQGRVETSPKSIADIQNHYYVDKVRLIRRSMPESRRDPLATLKKQLQGRSSSFSFCPVKPEQVDKIIKLLKNSKSSGVDQLDTYILKLARKQIVPAVCHILNLSIQTNKFPTKWKISKVVPLYKGKGSLLDPKNFRPVVLLPILSKVLERAIFLQIINYMDSNHLFNPNHHAYRSFHSTTTAMLQMYDTWLDAVEQGELAGICI